MIQKPIAANLKNLRKLQFIATGFRLGPDLLVNSCRISIHSYGGEGSTSNVMAQVNNKLGCKDRSSKSKSPIDLVGRVLAALRSSLMIRSRFDRVLGSLAPRQQYTCIRLYVFIVLIQACANTDDVASSFNNEPEFINESASLLSCGDAVYGKT
ncbi:hypothetical protein VNO77_02098 [Canavalia gladiata]|uniref:Uncharacterized protein n=1 Tax=Canavalia gladiata TaxID=3824 RepID=A0AAN9MT47_CANGL